MNLIWKESIHPYLHELTISQYYDWVIPIDNKNEETVQNDILKLLIKYYSKWF